MSNRKRQERQTRKAQQRRNRNLIFGLITVAVVASLGFFAWQSTIGDSAIPAADVPDPSLGNDSAVVEIVEYGDFGCHACQNWHNAGIRERIVETYGDQVQFVWRDFPVITPNSPKAAEAAQCAGAQGEFWTYHDYVYEQGGDLSPRSLKQYAQEVGLDQTSFDACLDQGHMADKVRDNEQQARRLGLRGTPGFSINGEPLPAPPSYAQLASLIEQAMP